MDRKSFFLVVLPLAILLFEVPVFVGLLIVVSPVFAFLLLGIDVYLFLLLVKTENAIDSSENSDDDKRS